MRLYVTTHSIHYPGEICPHPDPPAFVEHERDTRSTDWVLVSTAAVSVGKEGAPPWVYLYWTWEAR